MKDDDCVFGSGERASLGFNEESSASLSISQSNGVEYLALRARFETSLAWGPRSRVKPVLHLNPCPSVFIRGFISMLMLPARSHARDHRA